MGHRGSQPDRWVRAGWAVCCCPCGQPAANTTGALDPICPPLAPQVCLLLDRKPDWVDGRRLLMDASYRLNLVRYDWQVGVGVQLWSRTGSVVRGEIGR